VKDLADEENCSVGMQLATILSCKIDFTILSKFKCLEQVI
jgi:hypothetical protein